MSSANTIVSPNIGLFGDRAHLLIPAAFIGILIRLLVPRPLFLLDLLIALELTLSAVVLMVSIQCYAVLTVGDGLVTAMPSLLISVSGGLLTTNASPCANLGKALSGPVFGNSTPVVTSAGLIGILGLVRGISKTSFFILAGLAAANEMLQVRRPVSYLTNGQYVAQDIRIPSPESIAELFVLKNIKEEVRQAYA